MVIGLLILQLICNLSIYWQKPHRKSNRRTAIVMIRHFTATKCLRLQYHCPVYSEIPQPSRYQMINKKL